MSEDMNKPTSDTATISDTVNLPSTETTAQNTTTKTNDGSMSIIAHLTELRKRLIRSLIAIGVGSCIAYYFIEDIMHLLTGPAGKLYYMQPAEAFFTYIKVAIFVGFLIALPVVLYQIWRFVLPALIGMERYLLSVIVPVSLILFLAGIAFSFFLVLPAAVKFLVGFSTQELQPMFSIKQYFDFVIAFLLPFGFIFELPLAIILLAKVGIVSSKFLAKQQRIVIFLTFVIGAVISPTPDIFSQCMIAIPMILLYEISYVIVRFGMKK
ncbi:twin-arginine translocase subunit TatC [Megamonas hypermegale]|uniref:twin-arginine translocase subunit TatC n=1 Tax=Megamonas hypermegale TaxID=158847 RepID=UPI00195827AF|nr:twin-arginine translocase subunit TatC [Megamonas hypermegale]MBM6760276.1 twin-arginine translocase subunit TatC [Megamonas hypermegale]